MNPLVSIITPTYNHERFIGQCVESVLAQTYRSWELIIVDDGSTDSTWRIVQSYAARDSRIVAIRQPNKGIWKLSEAYNLALARSHGGLVAILEGDDYWPGDKLALQVPWHVRHPSLLMSYGRVAFVRDGKFLFRSTAPPVTGIRESWEYLRALLLFQAYYDPVGVVLSRHALALVNGFQQDPGFPAVDFSTFVRVAELPGSMAWLDATLGYYRQHGSQVTQALGVELTAGRIQIAQARLMALPPDLRAKLGVEAEDIYRAGRPLLADSHFGCVREGLKSRDRQVVERHLPQLWEHGGAKRKLQAIYAMAAVGLGFDMEPILAGYERVTGRRPL